MMAKALRLVGCLLVIVLPSKAVAMQQELAEAARSSPVSTWVSGEQQIWCFQFPLTEESPSGVFLLTDPEVQSVTVDEVLANGVGYNGLPLLRRMLKRTGLEDFEPGLEATIVWSAATTPFRPELSFTLETLNSTKPAAIPPGGLKLHGKGDLNFVWKIGGQQASTACIIFPNTNRHPEIREYLTQGRFVSSIDAAVAIAARDSQELWPLPADGTAMLPVPGGSILIGFSQEEMDRFKPTTSKDAGPPERDTDN